MTTRTILELLDDNPYYSASYLAQVKKTLLNGGIIGTNNNQLKMSKVNQIWRTLSKVNGTHVKCSQYVHDIIPQIGEVNILNQTLRFLIG